MPDTTTTTTTAATSTHKDRIDKINKLKLLRSFAKNPSQKDSTKLLQPSEEAALLAVLQSGSNKGKEPREGVWG